MTSDTELNQLLDKAHDMLNRNCVSSSGFLGLCTQVFASSSINGPPVVLVELLGGPFNTREVFPVAEVERFAPNLDPLLDKYRDV